MPAHPNGVDTIDEVLEALDGIIARALDQGSRVGYFAAIYRKVTAKVAEGIASGFFDDGERMERFDVTFANRYLAALAGYENGGEPAWSWERAFRATAATRPIILQHLLMGINAHINLDLGIAAAATAPGPALPDLRRDFDRINEILASLIAGIDYVLAEVSPWVGLLDRIGGRHDEEIIRFSIEVARTEAWRFAVELAPLARDYWAGPIGARDARVAHLARRVLNPGWLTTGLLVIRAREGNDARQHPGTQPGRSPRPTPGRGPRAPGTRREIISPGAADSGAYLAAGRRVLPIASEGPDVATVEARPPTVMARCCPRWRPCSRDPGHQV